MGVVYKYVALRKETIVWILVRGACDASDRSGATWALGETAKSRSGHVREDVIFSISDRGT